MSLIRYKKFFLASILFLLCTFRMEVCAQNVDSLVTALKNAKTDSVKCHLLNELAENADEGEWQKYNLQLKDLTQQKLAGKLSPKEIKLYKRYYADALNNIGFDLSNKGQFDSCLVYYEASLMIRKGIQDKEGEAISLNNIGFIYTNNGDQEKALSYFTKSLKILEDLGDKKTLCTTINNIGSIYDAEGDIPQAIDYYLKSLKIREELKDKDGIANSLNNLGLLYKNQGDLEKAESYFNRSLELRKEIHDEYGIAIMMNNLADVYDLHGDSAKALSYYKQSMKLMQPLEYKVGIAGSYNNIGYILQNQKKYDNALYYFEKALGVFEELGNRRGVASTLNNIGNTYYLKSDLHKAAEIAQKSLSIGQQIGNPETMKIASRLLFSVYKKQNKPKEALEMYELFVTMKDSLNNLQLKKMSIQKQFQYEYEKKEAANNIRVEEEKKLVAVQLDHERKQKMVLYAGIVLLAVFAIFIFNRFQVTKKQKNIIEIKESETQFQKQLVEVKQKEITDSIHYAKRLQNALLPSQEHIDECLPDNFVFYKPKDIVAGDFYWLETKEDSIFIAAADSTGHGVPGAIVSVVCSNALNRSVKEFGLIHPGDILDKTRELVLETFSKSDEAIKDGMDISLLCIDKKNKSISWAGANNPLLFMYPGDAVMREIKSDKQSIGKTDQPKPFTTHQIEYKAGTQFYLITDGFADQFGGPKGKKLMRKNLTEFIEKQSGLSMKEQKDKLDNLFTEWKGALQQIDDVSIIGIKIS